MGEQTIRQRARRTAREMADKRRRESAERERRVMELAEQVMVAIGERDEAVAAAEQRAARALRSLVDGEGLSLSEAAAWCGDTLTVREARRIRDLLDTDPPESDPARVRQAAAGRGVDRRGGGCGMNLVVKSPDELLAAVPHVLGFRPEESLVIVPSGGGGLPVARVDLPTTAEERDLVADLLLTAYGRLGGPGVSVGVVSQRRPACRRPRQPASGPAAGAGRDRHRVRLWADGEHWMEFTSGATGLQTREAADRVAVRQCWLGQSSPHRAGARWPSLSSVTVTRFVHCSRPPSARRTHSLIPSAAGLGWSQRVEWFHDDPTRLTDTDAARLLVGLQSIQTRDVVWESMTAETPPPTSPCGAT